MSKPQIFVACPIGSAGSRERRRSDQLLQHVIEPVANDLDYAVVRGDRIGKPGRISDQVMQQLRTSDVVIADLTDLNENVMYEVGVRHGLSLPIVLMAQHDTVLPFDLQDFRTIPYDLSLDGADTARNDLQRHLSAVRAEPSTQSGQLGRQIDLGAGVDLTRVSSTDDGFSTTVGGCEVRVVAARIERYPTEAGAVIALPCNEYFDDRCVEDTRSALGAYANTVFEGQVESFAALIRAEARRKFGTGEQQQKTEEERAESFGAGRCLLLQRPLGRSVPIALVATTTQRAGRGLSSELSYLFNGMRELATRLADARLNEVIMPVLGGGHGGIDPPLAFVGLLLAVAEAVRFRQGGQRLKRVTIVIFKSDTASNPEVDPAVVQRGLALIGSDSSGRVAR